MKGILEWAIFIVYSFFLAVMGHFGMQHTRFLLCLALLFGMSLAAILCFSILQNKNGDSGCREQGLPRDSDK